MEKNAYKWLDKIAISDVNNNYTYRDLLAKIELVEKNLQDYYNIKKDDIVCIKCDNSISAVILMLAINKIGASYLPIDIEIPIEREKYILTSLKPHLIITDDELNLISTKKMMSKNLYLKKQPLISGKNKTMYYIFTSGTTGKPKGIPIKETSVMNLSLVMNKEIFEKHNIDLTIGLMAPIHFDASIQFIFSTLMFGHNLHIITRENKLDPNKLCTYLSENKIDVIDCSPRHIQLLNESYLDVNKINVTHYVIGGEQLYTKYLKDFVSKLDESKNIYFTNVYGPSECCINSTIFHINNLDINSYKEDVIPIGRPIDNVNIFLLNKYDKTDILEGEICIEGVNLSEGYINKELNQNKFIRNEKISNKVFYRTGDFGRYNSDGDLIFLERKDTQVNIYGNRIELNEIKKTFDKISEVNDSYIKTEKLESSEFIIMYYCSIIKINVEEIISFLKKYLPDYMIPNFFVHVEGKFPLKNNGKIDISKLPSPFGFKDKIYDENDNIIEQIIQIFNKYLPSKINFLSNFKEVGGDSLTATRITSELKNKLEIEISTVDLLNSDTIQNTIDFIIENNKIQDFNSIDKKIEYFANKSIISSSKIKKRLQQSSKNNIDMGVTNTKIAQSYIKNGVNNVIDVDFRFENLEVLEVIDSIESLIRKQEVLRFLPTVMDGKFYFSSYSLIENLEDIELIYDISQYTNSQKKKIIKKLKVLLNNHLKQREYIGNLMYLFIVLKTDENSYIFIMSANHQIFDIKSLEIIKNHFLSTTESEIMDLKSYYDEILLKDNKLKYNIYSKSLFFDEYKYNCYIVNKKLNRINNRKKIYRSEPCCLFLSIEKNDIKYIFGLLLEIVHEIVSKEFKISKTPIRIQYNDRNFEGLDFTYTIGNFSDGIPCVLHKDNCYKQYRITKDFINSINMKFRELNDSSEMTEYIYNLSPFSLNFLGEVDYNIFEENLDLLGHHPYSIKAFINSGYLNIIFENGLNNVDLDKINEIISQFNTKSFGVMKV
ncbi:non-ribosomal peptide synthetase [Macrococcoides canis]|uniref:non-ribosomal peptide synthetase n=1 Tax=Macrococcoides canis TaxID=1855823 RepID=UPI0022793260|nr:non-ribosomal peptide synthetase [Macrococcus canis]